MINCQRISAMSTSNHHITKLTTSRISNYSFQIILHKSNRSRHQTGNCSNKYKQRTSQSATFPQSACTLYQINTLCYQSLCMDKCTYWSRSFHLICKPNMQSNLSRFSKGTCQNCQTKPISIRTYCTSYIQYRKISTSQIPPSHHQPNKKSSITNTINQNCFLCLFSLT